MALGLILIEVVTHLDITRLLLEYVLHGDDADGGAELVHHDAHLILARLEQAQGLVDGLLGR